MIYRVFSYLAVADLFAVCFAEKQGAKRDYHFAVLYRLRRPCFWLTESMPI